MTPAARLQTAIEILDAILDGAPAERELTRWARANRVAGSGDRAAIRDHVYTVLRCRESFCVLGGGLSGRRLILGMLRAQEADPEMLFTGERFAPLPLRASERAALRTPIPGNLARRDWPAWLLPELEHSLGSDLDAVSEAMRTRAPVFLRVNASKADLRRAQVLLRADGIVTQPHPLAATALAVTEGARRVRNSAVYRDGIVEVQDAASQAAVAQLPLRAGMKVLDYCAGGGGKALAMAAAWSGLKLRVHDADPGRMRNLALRAARAGARIKTVAPDQAPGGQDLVLVDAPCSGSGTWRRTPDAKWRLDRARLEELVALQAQILGQAGDLVRPGGRLAYMTCSLLTLENEQQVARFAQRPGWALSEMRRFTPLEGGDGFFCALFERATD